jgi:hypothetical protein
MTERAHIQLTRGQWRNLHNALCAAEQEARGLFAVLKDGGEGLAALKSVREALAPAYAQDDAVFQRQYGYFDETRKANGFRACWSMYDETDVGSFDQPHPYVGATHVVHARHWGTAGNVEVPILGSTWLDLYRASNEAIERSNDHHHIFIERFDWSEDNPGYLELVTGS